MKGKIRVLVPLDPWRLALSLRPVSLERERLICVLPQAAGDEHATVQRALFHSGDPYELQLEPEGEALPIPGVKARLKRLAESPLGLELEFLLEEPLEAWT